MFNDSVNSVYVFVIVEILGMRNFVLEKYDNLLFGFIFEEMGFKEFGKVKEVICMVIVVLIVVIVVFLFIKYKIIKI